MTKKKTEPAVKTFKPMPSAPEAESTPTGHAVTIANLMTVSGISLEQAKHMIEWGVPNDSYAVQTFYRITAQAADAVIKVFYG